MALLSALMPPRQNKTRFKILNTVTNTAPEFEADSFQPTLSHVLLTIFFVTNAAT
jgi:hypothetical protein